MSRNSEHAFSNYGVY